ncbi:MAG TPA: universal stress protein [Terriglobia bacterium]|jgi:nucleotide-binding universal stress UspA family protein|nr:universal stress protein [Terriglobia bacterium]
MIKFRRILFPTDFSPPAKYALDYAISLALEHEAKLFVLHVVEDIGFSSPFTMSSLPLTLEYQHGQEAMAKTELQKIVSPQMKRQLQVEEILVRGKPYVEIIKAAKENQADLIVIATHGKPDPKHIHLGSTAERVVRLALCPVLAVRDPDYVTVML